MLRSIGKTVQEIYGISPEEKEGYSGFDFTEKEVLFC